MKKLILLAMVVLAISGCATTKWIAGRLEAEWKEFADVAFDPTLNAEENDQ